MSKKAAGSYIKGATILTAAGILSRLLGLFFKVPLYQIIGSYGNGIYYNVTNIYNLLLMVSTVGLPTAISKMVSENAALHDYKSVTRVFNVSFFSLLTVGAAATAFLLFGAQWIIDSTGWTQDSYWSIIAIAPAPLIISLCSAYRGYFQGFQIMNPTAVSQILEQVVRVALGVLLAWYGAIALGNIGYGVAGSVFGATAGGIAALILLLVLYLMYRSKNKIKLSHSRPGVETKSYKHLLKRLVYIAIPVTLTSAIVSLFSVIDSWIYTPRLAVAGIDAITATGMIGDLGNAEILINIPLVISGNLAVATMPSISESYILGDKKLLNEKINLAIELIILVGLPCCIGLSVLSGGIFDLLFPGSEYGGSYLLYYAYVTLFMMLSNTFQSALQGIDKFKLPLYSLGIAAVIRFASEWVLLAIPSINLYGIIISGMLTFVFLTISNYLFLRKYTGVRIDWRHLLAVFASSAVMGLLVWLCYYGLKMFIPRSVSVIIAVVVGVFVYGFMMIITGGLTPEVLVQLPGHAKLVPLYNRFMTRLGRPLVDESILAESEEIEQISKTNMQDESRVHAVSQEYEREHTLTNPEIQDHDRKNQKPEKQADHYSAAGPVNSEKTEENSASKSGKRKRRYNIEEHPEIEGLRRKRGRGSARVIRRKDTDHKDGKN